MPEPTDDGRGVLVIDDDRGARSRLASVLENAGYTVTTQDPRAAIAEPRAHDFVVVALDATYGDEPLHSDLVERLIEDFPNKCVIVTSIAEDATRTYDKAIPIWTLGSTNFYGAVLDALSSRAPKRRCVVIMPFSDHHGVSHEDWNAFFRETIVPAVQGTRRFECSRIDPPLGSIFTRLIPGLLDADVVIADLTGGNPNVFYELGLRHAEPGATILIARDSPPPWAVRSEKCFSYTTDEDGRRELIAYLEGALRHIDEQITLRRQEQSLSDVSKAIEGRRRSALGEQYRELKKQALLKIETLRKLDQWADIPKVVENLPPWLAEDPELQRVLALAFNQSEKWRDAEIVLSALLARPDHAETLSMLGRVHKDRWRMHRGDRPDLAREELDRAIDAYARAYVDNPSSAYAGINAATLRTIRDSNDSALPALLEKLDKLVSERVQREGADYFDHASLLELALLTRSQETASRALAQARKLASEPWQLESTARNLQILRESRGLKDETAEWSLAVETQLKARAQQLRASTP